MDLLGKVIGDLERTRWVTLKGMRKRDPKRFRTLALIRLLKGGKK